MMLWFKRKEKSMFKEIEGFADKVAAKVKAAEEEVKAYFASKKAAAIDQLKFDINHFEQSLLEEGIKIDDDFSADLAKIKAKLEAEDAALTTPPTPPAAS